MKKRVLFVIPVIIFIVVVPYVVFPILNDTKANNLKEEMLSQAMPEKTELVEIVAGCGNTSGTGDHTEVLVCLLVKSELSAEELYEFFSTDYKGPNPEKTNRHYVEVFAVTEGKTTTLAMETVGLKFERTAEGLNTDDLYIVLRTEDAVSSVFDLRGK